MIAFIEEDWGVSWDPPTNKDKSIWVGEAETQEEIEERELKEKKSMWDKFWGN